MVLLLLWIYVLAALCLALYGLNTLLYSFLFLRTPPTSPPPVSPLEDFPSVTVQLPIYNELYVVERLIDAVSGLDWPRQRLQIQVLDDSDDETTGVAQARVDAQRQRGINIELLRRAGRRGFKAGALAAALPLATGEYIAIFDADFVPRRAFLKQTLPHLLQNPRVGLVQGRWGHLNSNYSILTRAQAIALDGHFVVEQQVRSQQGWFMNFNGTGGVWRRACIESVGGWHDDTLSEDLDLSYRAQLHGWKFLYVNDIVSPAELPPQIHAWKRQQFRWAKGSTQCLLKFTRPLLRADLPLLKRAEALLHLAGYLMQLMLLLMFLTLVPLTIARVAFPAPLTVFSLASLGPPLLYALSQRALYPDWRAHIRYFPHLLLLGIGLAWNNTLAIGEAITRRETTFRRTPKFNLADSKQRWSQRHYALGLGWESLGEILLTAYAVVGIASAVAHAQFWVVPFIALYGMGFGYAAMLSLWHARTGARVRVERTPVAGRNWKVSSPVAVAQLERINRGLAAPSWRARRFDL